MREAAPLAIPARSRCHARQCVHYIGIRTLDQNSPDFEASQVHVCRAFPRGIPQSISHGSDDHMEPVKGDNGIVYERFQGPDREYGNRPAAGDFPEERDLATAR